MVKPHFIVHVYLLLYGLALMGASLVLFLYQSVLFPFFTENAFLIFLVLFWSVSLLFLYTFWLKNELDVLIITNERIRSIEQHSFLHRAISECALADIKEVNAQTRGLLENLFDFGTLSLHTASASSQFVFRFTPSPITTASTIRNIIQENKGKEKE